MLLSNKLPSLRAVACDMASLVPMAVFESLEVGGYLFFIHILKPSRCLLLLHASNMHTLHYLRQAKPQRIFLSMLLGLTADAYPAVAAASLRALGAIVVFPSNAQVFKYVLLLSLWVEVLKV